MSFQLGRHYTRDEIHDAVGGGVEEYLPTKNGRVVASLSTAPPSAGAFSCPGGQQLVLASVAYTNIVLTDTTNNVSITVQNIARTFFDV